MPEYSKKKSKVYRRKKPALDYITKMRNAGFKTHTVVTETSILVYVMKKEKRK